MSTRWIHKVQYYETDRMGITHHSNYIRWMEESRIKMLESVGYGYDRFEEDGVVSPVVEVDCRFRESTTYPEEIAIDCRVDKISPVRLTLYYEMIRVSDGSLMATGHSSHCFTKDGRIVNLKREYPQFFENVQAIVGK